MFNKPVGELTSQDLDAVLGLSEAGSLECKRDAYGRADALVQASCS